MRIVRLEETAFINPEKDVRKLQAAGRVSFVSMAAISEDTCTIQIQEEREIEEVIKGYTYFNRGDILLAKITPCFENGKIAIADIEHETGFGSTEFHVLWPDRQKLDSRYLFYFLRQKSFLEEGEKRMTGSAGQKRIPVVFLKALKFPLPSLEEQCRIAAVLDKADQLRQLDRQLVAKYDQLTQSVFLDMFGDPMKNEKGWNKTTLESIAEIASGVTKGRNLLGKQVFAVPYLRVANVQDDHLDLNEIKTIEVLESDIVRFKLIKGDVLLTEGGDPDKLGRGAVWNEEIINCIHQNHIFRVRPNHNISNPQYLSTLIGSVYGKKYFLRAAKQTTGIATINSSQLKKFPVYRPPIELQNQFAEIVQNIESQKAKAEISLQKSEALFNALLGRAFRGELFSGSAESEETATAGPVAAETVQLNLF